MSFKSDIFEPRISFVVEENSADANAAVLCKVKGEFFVPNGMSRNKRFYPKELWEKTLSKPEIQKKLVERRMFGTIGHTQRLDDEALREGKVSHIVTNLVIDGDKGIGEAVILDTPAGRILNTVLRAQSKLFVSSRADGAYAGTHQGADKVDPDRYFLETFDFVIEPGFLQANPQLAESLQKLDIQPQSHSHEGDESMDKANQNVLMESLMREKIQFQTDLEKATTEIESLKAENAGLNEQLTKVSADAEEIKTLKAANEAAESALAAYKALGTAEEIKAAQEASKKFHEEVGSEETIREALTKAYDELVEFKALGTVTEVKKALELGTGIIESYRQLGTIPEIKAVLEHARENVEKIKAEKHQVRVKTLAADLKVAEAKVEKLISRGMSDEEIKELFFEANESANLASKYTKTEKTEEAAPVPTESKFASSKSLGERLMENLSKPAAQASVSEVDPTE